MAAKRKAGEDDSSTSKKRAKTESTSGPANKVTNTKWSAHETTYLEMVLKKLITTIKKERDNNQQAPSRRKIYTAFVDYFKKDCNIRDEKGELYSEREDRGWSSVESYLRKNEKLKELCKELYTLSEGRGGEMLAVPKITDDEIVTPREAQEPEDESGEPSSEPANDNLQSTTQPGKQQDQQAVKRRTRNRTMPKHEVESLPVTTPEAIAGLRATGYKFVNIEAMPSTDENAIFQHLAEPEKSVVSGNIEDDEKWLDEAVESYKTRLNDRFTVAQTIKDKPGCGWLYELHEGYHFLNHDKLDFHDSYKRNARAASTNALINAAVLPPIGYQGCLNDLIKNQRLKSGELALATQSKAMYAEFGEKHNSICGEDGNK